MRRPYEPDWLKENRKLIESNQDVMRGIIAKANRENHEFQRQ